jgi:trk system potassium uptake protein TrkH
MGRSFTRLRTVLTYVGTILFVFGFLMLIPFLMSLVADPSARQDVRTGTFAIPIFASLVLGSICRYQVQRWRTGRTMGSPEAMLICVLSWAAVSAVGAIPFSYHLGVSYLDAYFEAMSGFTTTGITMFSGLDSMPRSLLFWRSMTQWIGGLGILTFFMVIVYQGGAAHRLFGAESHKVTGPRPAPGMWNTLKILWLIYVLLTALVAGGLFLCGTGLYDAVSHAFTCLSTGGYSPYDASIAHYEQAGYAHHVAIEYILIFGMWAGGTNFLIHFRLIRGQLRALWETDEMRMWWIILGGSLVLVMGSRLYAIHMAPHTAEVAAQEALARDSLAATFRHSLFQVLSIASTTGYGTRDIATDYFTPLARQVFLVLMVIGGCVGSTGGGLKVLRIVVLWKLMVRQVRKVLKPDSEIELLLVDRKRIRVEEAFRTAGLFFAWVFLLFLGGLTTAAFSHHGPLESASGMFSALGNIGPCYITVAEMAALNPAIKLVYIAGMLAGRLEIIPLLMLFSRRTWE